VNTAPSSGRIPSITELGIREALLPGSAESIWGDVPGEIGLSSRRKPIVSQIAPGWLVVIAALQERMGKTSCLLPVMSGGTFPVKIPLLAMSFVITPS